VFCCLPLFFNLLELKNIWVEASKATKRKLSVKEKNIHQKRQILYKKVGVKEKKQLRGLEKNNETKCFFWEALRSPKKHQSSSWNFNFFFKRLISWKITHFQLK